MSEVTNQEELPSDFQVVATLVEQSLGLYHKILLTEDDDGSALFYRETTNYGAEELPIVLGPFVEANEALYGINLI
jgi:hypothetical protein